MAGWYVKISMGLKKVFKLREHNFEWLLFIFLVQNFCKQKGKTAVGSQMTANRTGLTLRPWS